MYNMLKPSRRLRDKFINGVHEFGSKAMNQASYNSDEGLGVLAYGVFVRKSLSHHM